MTKIVSKRNQIKSIIFVMALMVITISVILKRYSLHDLIRVIKGVHPFYLIAGVGAMVLYAGCQAMNFFMIMKTLGHPTPYRYCMEYAYIGNYFGAITPGASGGQPAQMYYMNKDGIYVDLSTITIFYMVLVSQIALVFLGGGLSMLRFPIASYYASESRYLLWAGTFVTLGLILIIIALMLSKRIVPFLLKVCVQLGVRIHIIKNPEEMKEKLEIMSLSYRDKSKVILKHPDLFVKVFLVTLLEWASQCLVSYLVYLSFGYRQHSAIDLMTCQSLINISVAAIPLPGSVGVAEDTFLKVYGQFYPQDILPSAMILNRIINFYLPLFISFAVYLIAHIRITKQSKDHLNNS
jgi:glycosyltransferase 2 family protein